MSAEEVAFFDALAQNEGAVEVLGDDKLMIIAREGRVYHPGLHDDRLDTQRSQCRPTSDAWFDEYWAIRISA